MTAPSTYNESLKQALRKIAEHIPEDLGKKFARESGMTKDDIHAIPQGSPGIVSAIDGSNTMIVEGGSVSIAAIRAVRTTFSENVRSSRSITPVILVTIGPGHRNQDFDEIYRDCFGNPPHKGLDNADPDRASAILRDTLEYWVGLQTAQTLPPGSLLLIDGALRVSSQNHEPVLSDIIRTAQARNLLLAAVAKRTSATWGGGHPLLPAAAAFAEHSGIDGPWWMKIDEHLTDHAGYSPGRHGGLYIASLYPKLSRPLKMELPKGTDDHAAAATMQALAASAGDGRVPGYPYPLLDAHRTVVIDEPLVMQIQQDIKSGLSKQGIQNKTFEDLFGDLHGEFERY
jgi:NurA domain